MEKIGKYVLMALCFSAIAVLSGEAHAGKIECRMCHKKLLKGKVVHPALHMGCATCHVGIDARKAPHKKTNQRVKGLSSEQPDLCYGCHDAGAYKKKNTHAAIFMGCTSCHNPHSSGNEKLLSEEPPDLCYNCHDKTGFSGDVTHAPVGIGLCVSCHSPHGSDIEKLLVRETPELCYTCHKGAEFGKKNVHQPVRDGMCKQCHKPHASRNRSLLVKGGNGSCLECHPEVRKEPHAISGFSTIGHPLGGIKIVRGAKGERRQKTVSDPKRPGKIFYCGSCHNPHSSDSPRLFRYKAEGTMGLCSYCHEV